MQIKPDKHEAWYNRSIALINLGRFKEALDSVDKALQIKPDFMPAKKIRTALIRELKKQ
ncbi:TPR repeat protein [Beggiatoa sp. PS]|nr:TPR repeat protein [Beggiatoa sp. PS]